MSKFNVGDLVQQLVEIHVSPIGIVVAIKEKASPLPSDVVEVLWINGDRRNEWTDNLRKFITPCQGDNHDAKMER